MLPTQEQHLLAPCKIYYVYQQSLHAKRNQVKIQKHAPPRSLSLPDLPRFETGGPGFVPVRTEERAAMAAALWELAVVFAAWGRWNLGLTGADEEFWRWSRPWAALGSIPSDVNCDERAAIAAALCVYTSLDPAEALGVRRLLVTCNCQFQLQDLYELQLHCLCGMSSMKITLLMPKTDTSSCTVTSRRILRSWANPIWD